jgi:hypothetical protein
MDGNLAAGAAVRRPAEPGDLCAAIRIHVGQATSGSANDRAFNWSDRAIICRLASPDGLMLSVRGVEPPYPAHQVSRLRAGPYGAV